MSANFRRGAQPPKGPVDDAWTDRPKPVIEAQYSGRCFCGDRWEPGEPIKPDGEGGWGHADCVDP